jgi:putative membrane protein
MINHLLSKNINLSGSVRLHGSILLLFHIVGIIGFSSPWQELFLQLTPFHLLLVFGYLVLFQEHVNVAFLKFMLTVTLSSYLIELAGVQTGKIFGDYQYGEALGIKIGGTPLLIGVLWFILIYSIGTQLKSLKIQWFFKALLGATMMLVIDLFIEPVAINLGFWSWDNDTIPVQNYVAWFTISFCYFLIFYKMSLPKNRIAPLIYWMQLGFFIAINFITYLVKI